MENKVITITGTRKGIGNYLAGFYLEKGFIVAGCSRGKQTIKHKNYSHYELDVANEKDVVNMIKDISVRFKRIDIMINNAGIAAMNHFTLMPLDTVRNIFETNFIGTFLFCREVSKVMLLKKYGKIINISSVAVPLALEGEAVYAASKAGVEEFTKVIAKELYQYGITVNCLRIAPLMTDLLKVVPEEKIQKILNMLPVKKFAEFKDVSDAIDFFIEGEGSKITGQVSYLEDVIHGVLKNEQKNKF